MMKRALSALLGIFAAASFAEGAVTREQLRTMAREKVDAAVMKALVERDCVDFDVDASNAVELSKELPAGVIEAAIRCRRVTVKEGPRPGDASAATSASEPAPAKSSGFSPSPEAKPAGEPATGQLQVRAHFIGESAALTCSCLLDGEPFATLSKPAQGEFGEAVARTKISKQSGFLAVPAGHHRVLFRCDPRAQEVTLELDLPAGERRTVEVKESTLRRWKPGKIDAR